MATSGLAGVYRKSKDKVVILQVAIKEDANMVLSKKCSFECRLEKLTRSRMFIFSIGYLERGVKGNWQADEFSEHIARHYHRTWNPNWGLKN